MKAFRIIFFSLLGEIGLIATGMVVGHVSILIFDAVAILIWLKCEKRDEKEKQKATQI